MSVIGTSQELDKVLRWYQALGILEALMRRGATVKLELVHGGTTWVATIITAKGDHRVENYNALGDALYEATVNG